MKKAISIVLMILGLILIIISVSFRMGGVYNDLSFSLAIIALCFAIVASLIYQG